MGWRGKRVPCWKILKVHCRGRGGYGECWWSEDFWDRAYVERE